MIEYGSAEDWYWDGRYEEVRFRIHVDGRPIQCRVTREYIKDRLVEETLEQPLTQDECLDTAKAHFDQITDEVGRRAQAGALEQDGSVLLRSLNR